MAAAVKLKKFGQTTVLQWFGHLVAVLVAFVLVVAALPFLLPISGVFRLYRRTLAYLIRRKHGDKVVLVSGDDSIWLQESASNRAIINVLLEFSGEPDLDLFNDAILDRLVYKEHPDKPGQKLYPKLTKYSSKILHRYVWLEEDRFDVKEHVFLHPKGAPKDFQELREMVGDMCSRPMPEKKAQWQLIVIPPGKKDSLFYALFRVHHSMADGISLVKITLQDLVDDTEQLTTSARFATSGMWRRVLKAVVEGPALLLNRLTWSADSNVLHGPPLSGVKVVSWSEALDIDLVKGIKNATGTTVNDVLMSCLAAAFREYFKQFSDEIPRDIQSYVPVDIRPASTQPTLDNQFALVFLRLPLDEPNLLDTLAKTKARMDKIKQSPEPVVNALVIKYAMSRLPNWLTKVVFDWFSAKCSILLTNVPGPQKKLQIAGHVIEDLIFWPPQRTNVAMGVSIFSYDGHVRIGIIADRSVLSNPGVIAERFVGQVHSLASQLKLE